jgi:FkbM family methyltransferase
MRVTLNEPTQRLWQRYGFEYLRYKYKLTPDDVVIDIGAYRGEWSKVIFQRYQCKIVMVEPGPWIVGCSYGEVINKAAWTCETKLTFGGDYYYTSSLEPGTTEYETFDINSLLAKYDEIALVKMNVEGAEYVLMNHIIDAGLHQRVKNFQIQFHQIEGEDYEQAYAEIEAKLSVTHEPQWRYRMCWENWRRK